LRDWTRSAGTMLSHEQWLNWWETFFWTLRFGEGVRAARLSGSGLALSNAGEIPMHPTAGGRCARTGKPTHMQPYSALPPADLPSRSRSPDQDSTTRLSDAPFRHSPGTGGDSSRARRPPSGPIRGLPIVWLRASETVPVSRPRPARTAAMPRSATLSSRRVRRCEDQAVKSRPQ
jgi:hypothetical protein